MVGSLLGIVERLIDRLLALESAVTVAVVFGWIALALVVALLASARGQSAVGFFFLALLLSSVLAALVLLLAPDERKRRQVLLEARIAQLEAHLGQPFTGADPSTPMLPPGVGAGKGGDKVFLVVLILLLLAIGVIGGVSQLGSSANATFTTIQGSM